MTWLLPLQLLLSVIFLLTFFEKTSGRTIRNYTEVKQGRIFSGVKTRQGDMPFIFKLPTTTDTGFSDPGCTAFLIAPKWALTAAHCYKLFVRQRILLANTPPESSIRRLTIDKFILHPNFVSFPKDDITLIRLRDPVQDIQPVRLNNESTDPLSTFRDDVWQGFMLTHAGYGDIDAQDTFVDSLYKTYSYLAENCPQDWNVDANRTFCTRSGPASETTCVGDSGSPVMWETETSKLVLGLISGGPFCDLGLTPFQDFSLVTRISWYLNWIKYELCKVGGEKFPYMEYSCPGL